MTKAVIPNKKSTSIDKPRRNPHDAGGKSKIKKADLEYHANQPHGGDIAKKHEQEEQPVHSVKDAPTKP